MTAPAPGAHGGDGRRLAQALGVPVEEVLDLSQSLNPCAPPVEPLLASVLSEARRYPDPTVATAALAEAIGVEAGRVLLTNGGAEAIALVAGELGGGVVGEPEFSLHPRGSGPRWASDPTNPTGRLLPDGVDVDVRDEAFYGLATGRWTKGEAVVVGSLTKVFACPGLRLGYVLAEPDLVARLRRRQPEWSVNGLAAAVVPALVRRADLPAWSHAVAGLRAELTALLGPTARPSDAPWVLVDDPDLRDRLAPHGILVRDCASFGLPGVARVAVPDADGLARLEAALR